MSLNIFSDIIGPPTYIGIDIGTISIKISQIQLQKGVPVILNYAIFEINSLSGNNNFALQSSSLKLYEDEVVNYLKIILKKMNISRGYFSVSIPSFSAFSTIINIPKMNSKEAEKSLAFKAKEYIPLPISEVSLDWSSLGTSIVDGVEVESFFLIAISNEEINRYKRIFDKANIPLYSLELEAFSLARILKDKTQNSPSIVVDIGSRSTNILVVKNGLLEYISHTDFASNSFTQSISSGLGIKKDRAEDIKIKKGLIGLSLDIDYELSTLIIPSLSVIIQEIKRAKDTYESRNNSFKINKIFLTGGGSYLIDLDIFLKKDLGLEVDFINSFDNFSFDKELQPLVKSISERLSVSLGLNLKNFIK